MAFRVYTRQVGQADIPGYRAPVAAPDFSRLGQGIQQLGQGIAQAAQNVMDKNDDAALQAAKVAAARKRLEYETNLDQLHGLDVMQRATTAEEDLQKELEKIGEGLNSRIQFDWSKIRDSELLGFKSSLNSRVVRESDRLADSTFDASIDTSAQKSARALSVSSGDVQLGEVNTIIQDVTESVNRQAKHKGMTSEMKDDLLRSSLTSVYGSAMQAQLARGDWKGAEAILTTARGKIDTKAAAALEQHIKAKRVEEAVDVESTRILDDSKYSLTEALKMVESTETLADEKPALRDAVQRKYQLYDAALREKDAPTMGTLIENLWTSNISPYSPRMRPLMDSLEPERRAQMAKEYYSWKRSRKTASAEDRRAQRDYEEDKMWQFKTSLFEPKPEHDPNDLSDEWFAGLRPAVRSEMGFLWRKVQGMNPEERRFVASRVDDFIARRELDQDEAKEIRRIVNGAVTEHLRSTGSKKFVEGELADVVEPALLQWEASRSSGILRRGAAWLPGVLSPEEKARESVNKYISSFEPKARPAVPDDVTDDEVLELRQEVMRRSGGVITSIDQVSNEDVANLYIELVAKGGIK